MRVALTGATGFIGSHVLTELHEHGHEVVALIRDDAAAERVAGHRGTPNRIEITAQRVGVHGATPTRIELTDRPAVVNLLSGADAAIHTASPGDATSADLDAAVAD